MKTAMDLHQTHDEVMESGQYVCEVGDKLDLKKGDVFPVCPRTGQDTTWRHTEHQHKTGDTVTEAGQYVDSDGEKVWLNISDTFPRCPKSGQATTWKHM